MSQPGKVFLNEYDNRDYHPGANSLKIILWYFTNVMFFINPLFPLNGFKICLLRLFGGKIGKGLIIKPGINIKYPWRLKIGDNVWIGEKVWIDNLANIEIGNNVCLSQSAYLLTGNHNYKRKSFDLIIGEIKIEDGAWIGARSVVCPGIICGTHSVLSVNSVATTDLEDYGIYQGNPAVKVRTRIID